MTSVKYFHSSMVGAPTLNGTPGTRLAVLNACLINGWGSRSVSSLVVASGVATATVGVGHSFEAGTVALVAGADTAALNGEKRVTATTTTTITFSAVGVPDQTASGAITAKLAPAGLWSKGGLPDSGNVGVFKSLDGAATGCWLRVDDNDARTARAWGYESMSDVNAGVGPTPSGGVWWVGSSEANAVARPWLVAADSRQFYLFVAYNPSFPALYLSAGFGDIVARKSPDPWACVIQGYTYDPASTWPSSLGLECEYTRSDYQFNNSGGFVVRSYTGIGAAVSINKFSPTIHDPSGGQWLSGGTDLPYPEPATGALIVVPSFRVESASRAWRGYNPGLYLAPHGFAAGTFSPRDKVTGVTGLEGRTLMAVGSVQSSVLFVDVTGPWR